MDNKTILKNANAAVSEGNHEEFLSYLTENTMWTFVGDQTLSGKDEVRKYIADAYKRPPRFDTRLIIAEGDYLAVTGKKSAFGKMTVRGKITITVISGDSKTAKWQS